MLGGLSFFSWLMADRFDVVAIRIEDEGRIVALMVLRAKPGTTVVASARCECLLVEGIHAGAVGGGERDVDGLARIILADPEVRLKGLLGKPSLQGREKAASSTSQPTAGTGGCIRHFL